MLCCETITSFHLVKRSKTLSLFAIEGIAALTLVLSPSTALQTWQCSTSDSFPFTFWVWVREPWKTWHLTPQVKKPWDVTLSRCFSAADADVAIIALSTLLLKQEVLVYLSFTYPSLVNQVTPDTRAHLSFPICVAFSMTLLSKSNELHFANETVCAI